MILCIDVGNSQIYCGICTAEATTKIRFRYPSKRDVTSDQLGVFFCGALRENGIDPKDIKKIAICSVVPQLDYSLRSACKKYLNNIEPFFLLPHAEHGLAIQYRQPEELGADRLANAIAAVKHYPHKNIIVVDFGTATTFCAISAAKEYLGGAIMPGIRTAMEALYNRTAKLSPVEIIQPEQATGVSTIEGIQAGLYYSQLGACKEIIKHLISENFKEEEAPVILGTGGFSHLFRTETFFTTTLPDLVLDGLLIALHLN